MGAILGFILKFLGSGLGKAAIDGLLSAQKQRLDAANEEERIAADQNIAFWQEQVKFANAAIPSAEHRQELKMNHLVFWFILGAALLPGLGTFLLLSVYNVLWWEHGIWPQGWGIAAFPPPYDGWAQMSIEWVFDPWKLAATTGIAVAGGYVTGRRK